MGDEKDRWHFWRWRATDTLSAGQWRVDLRSVIARMYEDDHPERVEVGPPLEEPSE